jgi:hypothetical protein
VPLPFTVGLTPSDPTAHMTPGENCRMKDGKRDKLRLLSVHSRGPMAPPQGQLFPREEAAHYSRFGTPYHSLQPETLMSRRNARSQRVQSRSRRLCCCRLGNVKGHHLHSPTRCLPDSRNLATRSEPRVSQVVLSTPPPPPCLLQGNHLMA